jgi:hypothetical protein
MRPPGLHGISRVNQVVEVPWAHTVEMHVHQPAYGIHSFVPSALEYIAFQTSGTNGAVVHAMY